MLFACFDVETTGLSPTAGRVIEVAVVHSTAEGEVVGEWSTLVDAAVSDVGRVDIHGITPCLLEDAPSFPEVAGDLAEALSGCVPVAHNAAFDVGFVRAEWTRAGLGDLELPAVDTVPLARLLGLPGRLGDLAAAVGVELTDAHRALDDSRALAGVLAGLLARGADVSGAVPFQPPLLSPAPSRRSLQREPAHS